MATGDRHRLNHYEFVETMYGPMQWGTCIDCGTRALEVGDTSDVDRFGSRTPGGGVPARCATCGRAHHNADLSYYNTGRADVYRRVEVNPVRVAMSTEGFFYAALHMDEQRTICTSCGLPIDPAARTVEHPDRHPSCDRYQIDAPMETALGPEG